MKKYTNKQYIDMYMEWVNDFLTLNCFAEHHGISKKEANHIVNTGKFLCRIKSRK